MRSKIFLLAVLLVLISGTILVQAIQEPRALGPADLPALPSPGLIPGDFFYFLDMWGEAIGEFFIFRPEDRARLQAERVLERTAEIKALVKRDGVDSPYLTKTKKRIQDNMARAATILEEQKARGIVVAGLAKEMGDKFNARRTLLEGVFEITEQEMEAQEKALKVQIREARRAGDFEGVRGLQVNLVNIRAQKERISTQKDYVEVLFEIEAEKIEGKMEIREREMRGLAREARTFFDQKEKDLERVFKQRERALGFQEKALEIQLRQAILVEDAALVEQIKAQLLNLEGQENFLEREKGAIKMVLEGRRRGLERVITMREGAMEQIKEAREELLDIKEEKAELIVDLVEIPAAVLELIGRAENKLIVAEDAFAEGSYGKAFGQAMAVEMLVRNAGRMLEEKGEAVEKLKELEEKLEEVGRSEEVLREAQRRLEQAPVEAREEIEKEVEEAHKQYQKKLKELEKKREEVGAARRYGKRYRDPIPMKIERLLKESAAKLAKREPCSCQPQQEAVRQAREALILAEKLVEKYQWDLEEAYLRHYQRYNEIVKTHEFKILVVELKWRFEEALEKVKEAEERLAEAEKALKECLEKIPKCPRKPEEPTPPVTPHGELIHPSPSEPRPLLPAPNGPVPDLIRRPDDGRRRDRACQTDRDCIDLICPMVIGGDTPRCGPDGICICGPRRDVVPFR